MENMKCVICGEEIKGFGNNADPLAKGKCCDECNSKYVLLVRTIFSLWEKDKVEMKRVIDTARKTKLFKEPKPNDLVAILEMNGEPQYTYKAGRVLNIDDLGQVHGTWGGCALVKDLDYYWVVKES